MDDQVTAWALAAARGSHGAAAAFVRATQADVTRFLTHLGAQGDAEDLTQETYLRAFRSLPRFAGQASARTWLFAIARRVAADHVRALKRRPRTVAPGADPPAVGRFDEQLALRDLLDTLPPEQREAFVATQVVGLSYEEAAEVCGCPVGTIRSRVARARGGLVARLGFKQGDGRQAASR